MRIPYATMQSEFRRVLTKYGFSPERATLCANLFTDASRDGVYTHGLNRFPSFIRHIQNGCIDIHAVPEKVEVAGVLERWDGKLGPGNLNAHYCMDRAIQLARQYTVGYVALRNTNHWMRAGAYGLQAVDAGCIGICWTNTTPNMPPWGAKEPKLGNNPIVFAVPRPEGPLLLDMAASMFSYGKLESYARRGEMLPVDGGFTQQGALTRDAAAILESRRPLPIGCWKGSGLSLLLDLITVILSGGQSTYQIGKSPIEMGLSQTFIALDLSKLSDMEHIYRTVNETIKDLHDSTPIKDGDHATYPGERMILTREENLKNGIPVEEIYWEEVLRL